MIQVRFPKPFQTALCAPFPEGSAAIPDVKTWCGGGGREGGEWWRLEEKEGPQLSGGWWRKGNLMGKGQYKA